MPTVKLQFPGGRYHATPWGHHVNEGLVEWPPSPWRLLRALIARGFSSQGWDEVPPLACRLIEKLAAVLPLYWLPPVSVAHTRHFMPVGTLKQGREETTLVFDTWANLGNNGMWIHWPCELDDEEQRLLQCLLVNLGYLGRSESWVEAQLVGNTPDLEWNAIPCQERQPFDSTKWEQISLMAARSPSEYEQWRSSQIDEASGSVQGQKLNDAPKKKAPKKKQAKVLEPYPPNLVSCLCKDTAWWKNYGWSLPPGSQRVLYQRRHDAAFEICPVSARQQVRTSVEMALLAITTPSGNRSALPPITRTLPQAELFHQTLVNKLGQGHRVNCPELTGKDKDGKPLQTGHQHVHTIPLALSHDNRIDHILIFAKVGFDDAAQTAIRKLDRTWTKNQSDPLQVALAGLGSLEDLRRLPSQFGRRIERLLGPARVGSRRWVSWTPYVPSKAIDHRPRNSLESHVQSELRSRGFPGATRIEIDARLTCALRHFVRRRNHVRHFVRRRNHGGGPPPMDMGFGLRLEFAEPVAGPLMLGYASHYGLGLFWVDEKEANL